MPNAVGDVDQKAAPNDREDSVAAAAELLVFLFQIDHDRERAEHNHHRQDDQLDDDWEYVKVDEKFGENRRREAVSHSHSEMRTLRVVAPDPDGHHNGGREEPDDGRFQVVEAPEAPSPERERDGGDVADLGDPADQELPVEECLDHAAERLSELGLRED